MIMLKVQGIGGITFDPQQFFFLVYVVFTNT